MRYLLLLTILLASCATPPVKKPDPTKPAPTPVVVQGKKHLLWSTFYFTPYFKGDSSQKYCLRNVNGECLSDKLSLDQWCMIGLQGTGRVKDKTFTYAKRTRANRVPCEKSFLKNASFARKTGEIKFSESSHINGYGNRNNSLTAYKSIACDQSIFKFGQKFYIPKIKKTVTCHDVGGAIKGNHIDTFIGLLDLSDPEDFKRKYGYAIDTMPEEWKSIIKSVPEGTFEAYEVD